LIDWLIVVQVSAFTGGRGHGPDVIAQWRHQQVPACAVWLRATAPHDLWVRRTVMLSSQRPSSAVTLPASRARSPPDGSTGRRDVTHCRASTKHGEWRRQWQQ